MLLMLVPYLPWFKPETSHQYKIDESPPDELREEIDSDGDLLVDNDELYVTETDMDDPDTDNDGIIDGEEYKFWTEKYKEMKDKEVPEWLKKKYPYLSDKERKGLYTSTGDVDGDGKPNIKDKDSDGDGLPDGFEISYDLDPADPTSNFTDLPPEQQRYLLVNSLDESNKINFEDHLNMNEFYDEFSNDKDFNDIVFRVTPAAYPRYWRTAVLDKYNSGIWDSSYTNYGYFGEELGLSTGNKSIKENVTYSVTFNGMVKGAIPTALHTTRVFSIKPDSYTTTNDAGTFEVNNYIKSYFFNATVFEYDLDKLKNANAPSYIPNSHLLSTVYIHEYIIDLGKEITSEYKYNSDFEKASAIAKYLRSNYIYDLNSYEYNLNYPNSDYKLRYLSNYDKVLINILFKTHRGHCTDFATAFVLMCRANDIPAQLVVGYAPGEIDDPTKNSRVIRVGHKHSWAEVYFNGYGWVPFEVTPSKAIHGNTTGVSTSGDDEGVISYPGFDNATINDIENGTGGGTTSSEYIDIMDLINHPKLDSDGDGLKNDKDIDDDNDGLTDLDEIEIGTDPFKKDTDKDRLSDYEEVKEHKTSPLNSDSDSDGLTDYFEIITTKTDPLEYDTDGGGAYDGLEIEMDGDPLNKNDDEQYIDSDNDGLTDAQEKELGTNPNLWDTDGGGASDKLEQLVGLDPIKNPDDDLKVLDSDDDGLMDAKEVELGTDRFDYDSDDGGIGDGIEYLKKNNPLNQSDDFWLMDSDNDGLNNGDEEKWGTDYYDEDTDDGGVSDGVEVDAGTNPLNPNDDSKIDSDKDGLTNIVEKKMGTNEFIKDTDNDNLPDGWIDYNDNDRLDLGEFEDRNLNGITDSTKYHDWNNGTGPGETDPRRYDTDSDGLSDGIEIKIGTNPLDYDTDDDGLSDSEELRLLTNPNIYDTDNDGLSDGEEVNTYKSNPTILDTDGDGLDDWLESVYGTSPTSVDTDGDGLLDFEEIDWGAVSDRYPNIELPSNTGTSPVDLIRPDPPIIQPAPSDPGYQPDLPDPDISGNSPSNSPDPGLGGNLGGSNFANVWPIIIGLILIIIIGFYYMTWRSQHLEEIAEVAERAEEQLSKIDDEREFDNIRLAIFEAYRSMLKVMQRYDFVRDPAMTPSEFKNVIAKTLPISDKNIESLTLIFEEARYSNHKLNIKIKNDAIKSFRDLKNELRGVRRWAIKTDSKAAS